MKVPSLKDNLEKIRAGIPPGIIPYPRIIAVSKKQPISKIQELYQLGIRDFGENYIQEALEKMKALSTLNIRWHYLGQVQSKKIKDIVGRFHLIHSVARLSEVEKISQVAWSLGSEQNVLVQVNIAREVSKQGVPVEDLPEFLKKSQEFRSVHILGLMIFPPQTQDQVQALKWFSKASELFQQMKEKTGGVHFCHLSMGTSGDFQWAVRKGATDIRIGEALMGPRYKV